MHKNFKLQRIHKIELLSKYTDQTIKESVSNVEKIPFPKLKFKNIKGCPKMFARCIAEDDMSVRTVQNSKIITEYLNMQGFKSENTIWNLIEKFYSDRKLRTVEKLKLMKNLYRIYMDSIKVDEWSDNSNMKYINVSMRSCDPTKHVREVFIFIYLFNLILVIAQQYINLINGSAMGKKVIKN